MRAPEQPAPEEPAVTTRLLSLPAGQTVLAGMQWRFVGDATERRDWLRDRGPGLVLRRPLPDGELLGWAPQRAGAAAYAGALVLGLAQPDAVFWVPLPGGGSEPPVIWFCALREGLPLPGMDRVCSPEQAQQLLSEVASFSPDLALYGPLAGAVSDWPAALSGLPVALPPALRPTSTKHLGVLHAAVPALVLLVAAGWLLWPQPADPVAAAAAAPTLTAPPQPAAAPPAPQDDGGERLAQWLAAQPLLADAAPQWLQTLRGLPLVVQGWRLRQLRCDADACELVWEAGEDRSGWQRLPGEALSSPPAGDRAVTRWPLQTAASRTSSPLTLAEWSAERDALQQTLARARLRLQQGSEPQSLGTELAALPARLAPLRASADGWVAAQHLLDVLSGQALVQPRMTLDVRDPSLSLRVEAFHVVAQR